MLTYILSPLFNGLFSAMVVFLFATGLTLIFGILRVLNFAHGGFFMIGAYVAFSLVSLFGSTDSMLSYLLISVASGLVLGTIGLVVERFVFRPLQKVDEAYSLIATYALLLLTEGAVKAIWGVSFHSVAAPEALAGIYIVGDLFMPTYAIFVIGLGIACYLVLEWALQRTETGKLTQSIASDPWMAQMLGVNVPRFYTWIVVFGFFLAGIVGGLLLPNQTISPNLASTFVVQAFGVLIVGGMGNIRGTFLAAILLCVIDSFGSVYFSEVPGMFFYFAMVFMLLLRPEGLVKGSRL
ncbi:amino acid/amide ABC transporter membrane protein 1, HAAT family [Hoeflea sp. IMCC20628]|uniref:branched-chain amino acid ABC transporter permease n=1 Tax=Hoeflea sp. IMCC20628 TaxID=1620421 RepID=UPI00063BEC7A|nr:branched-chain amino acid ABC transporter permease [Hoeflea sp. IMCC20628]AKH98872.1 amino acid/amide ABC transporter membrane protein 1, HAAT family [Hoeflea sp. IMCC20628]